MFEVDRDMPVDEFFEWAEIYAIEADEAKRARSKAKTGRRSRGSMGRGGE